MSYRGRLAPSPTGLLHLGHARTFWAAWRRARAARGTLVFRNEDLDPQRCRPEFVQAMFDDLRWLGLDWDEGPDMGGPYISYAQSQRRNLYLETWRLLRDCDAIYPCTCSRKDLLNSASAPHEEDDELRYPGTCRNRDPHAYDSPTGVSWRFRVPDGERIKFDEGYFGPQQFTAGADFSDFLVWRRDDMPAYQLAVVADDAAMQITEVVRGADLLRSTARQLLLYRALGLRPPAWLHCPLMADASGHRLAKRTDALSLARLRANGGNPKELIAGFERELGTLL